MLVSGFEEGQHPWPLQPLYLSPRAVLFIGHCSLTHYSYFAGRVRTLKSGGICSKCTLQQS